MIQIYNIFFHPTLLYHSRKKKKEPTTAHVSSFRTVVTSLSRIVLNKGTKRSTSVKQQEGMPVVWPKETHDFSLTECRGNTNNHRNQEILTMINVTGSFAKPLLYLLDSSAS